MKSKVTLLGALACVVLGLVFFGVSMQDPLSTWRMRRLTAHTRGHVTGYSATWYNSKSGRFIQYAPAFVYQDARGRTFRAYSAARFREKPWPEGMMLNVVYNPEDPFDAELQAPEVARNIDPTLWVAFVLLLAGGAMVGRGLQQRRTEREGGAA